MDRSRLKQLANQIRQQEEHKKSMKVARKRQLRMLPKLPKVPGMEFHSVYLPADNVSGDFYDFIPVKEGLIGIAMGDVSGHGPEAALIMGMAKKALQIYAKGREDPKETLAVTNADLAQDLDGETFVSASYGILDIEKKIFRFARAGHNPPMLINPNRDPVLQEIKPNGMIIGVDKSGKRFPMVMKEEAIQLVSGDLFFHYTDGLVEAHDRDKNEFGEDRLKDILIRNYNLSAIDLINLLEETIFSFSGSEPQEDDISMIAFKVL